MNKVESQFQSTVLERILRRHIVLSDGYIRDTAMFSITDEKRLAVKAGLEQRLGNVP